jgi:hypothetical protein
MEIVINSSQNLDYGKATAPSLLSGGHGKVDAASV